MTYDPDESDLIDADERSFHLAQDIAVDAPDIATGYASLLEKWMECRAGHPATPVLSLVDPVADGQALLAWLEQGLRELPASPDLAGLWFEFIGCERVYLLVSGLYVMEPEPDQEGHNWDFGGWGDFYRERAGLPPRGDFLSAAYPDGCDGKDGFHGYAFDLAYSGLLAAHVGRNIDPALLKLDRPDALFYAGFHDGDAMLVGKLSQSGGWRPNTTRELVA